MPIPSHNFGAVLFLSELGLQCQLLDRSIRRLEHAAQHWLNLGRGVDDGQKAPPLDIVADSTVCLSAMAAVRRMLHPPEDSTNVAKQRSRALRSLLGDPLLPSLMSLEVRNSWEHFDERLDRFLSKRVQGQGSVAELHVSAEPPRPDTTALRRFDPAGFAIHFADQCVALRPCMVEMNQLSALIEQAYVRLQTQRVDV